MANEKRFKNSHKTLQTFTYIKQAYTYAHLIGVEIRELCGIPVVNETRHVQQTF